MVRDNVPENSKLQKPVETIEPQAPVESVEPARIRHVLVTEKELLQIINDKLDILLNTLVEVKR